MAEVVARSGGERGGQDKVAAARGRLFHRVKSVVRTGYKLPLPAAAATQLRARV